MPTTEVRCLESNIPNNSYALLIIAISDADYKTACDFRDSYNNNINTKNHSKHIICGLAVQILDAIIERTRWYISNESRENLDKVMDKLDMYITRLEITPEK